MKTVLVRRTGAYRHKTAVVRSRANSEPCHWVFYNFDVSTDFDLTEMIIFYSPISGRVTE